MTKSARKKTPKTKAKLRTVRRVKLSFDLPSQQLKDLETIAGFYDCFISDVLRGAVTMFIPVAWEKMKQPGGV